MKNRFSILIRFVLLTSLVMICTAFLASCTKQVTPSLEDQNGLVSLDYNRFLEEESSHFVINSATVIGDVLEIEISASGCSGMTWRVGLVDSEIIAKSLPLQRYIRLTFDNGELCLAYITKKYTFNLRPIRVKGYNKIHINLNGWENPLIYSY